MRKPLQIGSVVMACNNLGAAMRSLDLYWLFVMTIAIGGISGCADPVPLTNPAPPPAEIAVPSSTSGQDQGQNQNEDQNQDRNQNQNENQSGQALAVTTEKPANHPAAAPPTSTAQATITPPPQAELRLRLRGGVALPQTLPTGTAMGFSVEYQVQAGAIDPGATYEWVIESPQGATWKQVITLQSSSSLETFVADWPAEPGTYTTYIQATGSGGVRRVITDKVKLTYSCQ